MEVAGLFEGEGIPVAQVVQGPALPRELQLLFAQRRRVPRVGQQLRGVGGVLAERLPR